MKIARTLLSSPVGVASLAWIAATYLRLVRVTGRCSVVGGQFPARLIADDRPFVVAFWHGRMMMMPFARPSGLEVYMLSSNSRDGGAMSATIGRLGVRALRGSSGRDGGNALRAMVRTLKAGDCVGITPDGPRGPRMRASLGAVSAARLAGVPILPVSCASSRRRVLSSWDRMCLPLPFARSVFVFGRPVEVAADADAEAIEAARLALESRLNAATLEADLILGLPTVAPAPVAAQPESNRTIGADGP